MSSLNGELHNTFSPMWSLFKQPDRSEPMSRQNLWSGTVVTLFVCEHLCVRACGYVFSWMYFCFHLFTLAPPSSHWQLACLHFHTHSGFWQRRYSTNTVKALIKAICVACNNTEHKKGMEAAQVCTGTCGCWWVFLEFKLLSFVAVLSIELSCNVISVGTHLAPAMVHWNCRCSGSKYTLQL